MERRITAMVAAAGVLIVLFVLWDIFKPAARPAAAPEPEVVVTHTDAPEGNSSSQGTAPPNLTPPPSPNQPNYMEALARYEMRRRIRANAGSTYLNEMLAASGDSMLRRWDNRQSSPVRVYFAPTLAANFQPAFVEAGRRAVRLWTAAGVPRALSRSPPPTHTPSACPSEPPIRRVR